MISSLAHIAATVVVQTQVRYTSYWGKHRDGVKIPIFHTLARHLSVRMKMIKRVIPFQEPVM